MACSRNRNEVGDRIQRLMMVRMSLKVRTRFARFVRAASKNTGSGLGRAWFRGLATSGLRENYLKSVHCFPRV